MFQNKMQKFTSYRPNTVVEHPLQSLCESLHVTIDGPIETFLPGQLTIEGTQDLLAAVDKILLERMQTLLMTAKEKALSGDLQWFDQKIAAFNDGQL